MKLLADESVDGPIIARLRSDGHDVISIAETHAGMVDDDVLALAWQAGVVLLTADKDFGEMVYRQRLPHTGVLLLRLAGLDEHDKCSLVAQAVFAHGTALAGTFSVLSPQALRIRPDPLSAP